MINRILQLAVLTATFCACQPESTSLNPDRPNEAELPAEVTEAGKPVGAPVQRTIGPEGGVLTAPVSGTADQTVTLSFPAGALSTPTPITLQVVENKAPGGVGPALEISPKTIRPNKPVALSWNYGPGGLNGTGAAAVGLAYQQETGSWAGKTDVTVDEARQTLTVTRPTFDLKRPLAFYANYYLKYNSNTLLPNEQLEFSVAYQPNHSDQEEYESRESLLAPLKSWDPVGHENLENWRINGARPVGADKSWGTLSVINKGEKALYIAPDRLPKVNPAAISVNLKTGGRSQVMLVGNVQVVSPNRLTAMGKAYENPKVVASISDRYLFVALTQADAKDDYPALAMFTIRGQFNGKGTYTMEKKVDPDVYISGKEEGEKGRNFTHVYTRKGETVYATGTITITEYTGPKGKVAGSFSATLYDYNQTKDVVRQNTFGGTFSTQIN